MIMALGQRAMLKTIPVVLAFCGAFLMISCSKSEAVRASTPPDLPTVAVAKVATEDLSHGMVLTAEFKPYQEVDVMAKVAGYVKQINVDVGDRVTEGPGAGHARDSGNGGRSAPGRCRRGSQPGRGGARQGRIAAGRSRRIDIAHLSYQRLSGVLEKKPGLVAQQEIDDAQSKDLVAEAQVSAAKSALAAAKEQVHVNTAELQKVHTLMDYTRVTAPFAGVVTKRYADKGSMIQAGTASQTQAMPVVRISREQPAPPDPAGARIGRSDGAHRSAGGRSRPHAEPQFSGEGRALRREGLDGDAHDGHGSRCSEPQPGADSRDVRRGEPDLEPAQRGAGRPGDGGGPRWRERRAGCWWSRPRIAWNRAS